MKHLIFLYSLLKIHLIAETASLIWDCITVVKC